MNTAPGPLNASSYNATSVYRVADRGSGGWTFQPVGGGDIIPYRRLEFIKNDTAIMGEAYHLEVWDSVNLPSIWGLAATCTNQIANANGPAWYHQRHSNFLFKDGHVQTLRFTGGVLFSSDFVLK